MIIKVFQKNKNGNIELSTEELEKILNEAYWDGYSSNSTWTYKTPNVWTSPYNIDTSTLTITTTDNTNKIHT